MAVILRGFGYTSLTRDFTFNDFEGVFQPCLKRKLTKTVSLTEYQRAQSGFVQNHMF